MSTSFFANKFSVGLTGGIGCGKTTIADMFAKKGVDIIDADCIAHQLTTADGLAIPAIQEQFGADFLTMTGAMDRVKMRAHVFQHAVERKRLEAILHPMIEQESLRMAMQARGNYVIFVLPLLLESGILKQYVSRILVIDCSEMQQIQRVMERNKWNEDQVRTIMATQVSRNVRLAAANDIIVNDHEPTLMQQVTQLHALYMTLAKSYEKK